MTAAGAAPAGGVAVIGVGCRFAGGAEDVDQFWAFLDRGGDAIGMVPGDRWEAGTLDDYGPPAPGEPYRLQGAFIEDIAGWDAQLFRASAQEALRTDPQHRLVFEVVWRALEDAGIDPAALRSTDAGVFVGVTVSEQYARLQRECDPACGGDPYMTTGSSPSMAAGRLAYFLGTHGPALSIDTACSTSLVAIHLARQSLLRGECDLAIVAAATALTYPDTYTATYRVGMLAEDSRCRAFDRRANGFSLGEGAGAVVLCRLADADRPGRRVRAIARGTAVNSDGGGRGLTAPNRHAQVAVIRAALRSGGLAPDDVALVEAHGSGTALGDAIELEALGEVFGPRPIDRPLYVGAVKTNLGHLLSAAGMAGFVKALLALEHRRMPPNLHFETPNPILRRTPWLVPPTAPAPLAGDGPLVAGISSFGWSGTNAHVVLERPAGPAAPVDRPPPRPFTRVRYWPRPVGDRWAVRAAKAGLAPAGLANAGVANAGVADAGLADAGLADGGVADGGLDSAGGGNAGLAGSGVASAGPAPAASGNGAAVDRLGDAPGTRALFCYARTWRQTVAPPVRAPGSRPGPAVLLADEPRTAETVAAALRAAGWSVVTAGAGDGTSLESALAAGAGDVHLVSCLTADPTGMPPADRARAAFAGLMTAVQLATRSRGRPPAALLAVVSGTVDVLGGDAGSVGDAAVAGLCRAMRAEYPMLRTRVVDVDPATAREASAGPVLAAQVLAELDALTMPAGQPGSGATTGSAGPSAPVGAGSAAGAAPAAGPDGDVLVGWRNGRRWVPDWSPLEPAAGPSPWRAGGVYVITGGTRGLGLALARHLAAAGAGGLVLAGRTPLPPRREWDAILLGAAAAGEAPVADSVRRTIGDVRRLERTGTAVLALAADVSTPAGMREVLRLAAERFGRVHGVAHCAGVPGGGLLDRKTPADAAAVIDPKVAGLPALDEAIRAGGLEVVVLYSSAVTALGGLGESDYAAANACLEAFAAAHAGGPTRVLTVAWGAWQHETGPGAAVAGAPWLAQQVRRYRAASGIPLADGTGLVDRLAGTGQPVALVLTEPIETARAQWAALADIDALAAGSARGPAQPRPDLAVAYVPPGAGLQTQIAAVWQHYLGLTDIGIDDPFFELGGTSLVSVSIARRLERELEVALTPAALFEWPTIRELAAALSDPAAAGPAGPGDPAGPAGPGDPGDPAEADAGELRRQLRSVSAQARRRGLESRREERP